MKIHNNLLWFSADWTGCVLAGDNENQPLFVVQHAKRKKNGDDSLVLSQIYATEFEGVDGEITKMDNGSYSN